MKHMRPATAWTTTPSTPRASPTPTTATTTTTAIGHLESVKKMVEEDRDCAEVLIQLAAVRSALTNTGKVILKDHMDHCIVDAVEHKDLKAIEDLNRAIEQFIK